MQQDVVDAQQLRDEPFPDETFAMALYVPEKEFPAVLPPLKDLYGFLDKHATKIDGLVVFPEGTTTKFFDVWKGATGKDLMPIVGGTTYENPPEEELAAGAMETEKLREIYGLMKAVMNDSKRREEQLVLKAKQKKLDSDWFMKQSFILLKMIDSALAKNAPGVIGLYE